MRTRLAPARNEQKSCARVLCAQGFKKKQSLVRTRPSHKTSHKTWEHLPTVLNYFCTRLLQPGGPVGPQSPHKTRTRRRTRLRTRLWGAHSKKSTLENSLLALGGRVGYAVSLTFRAVLRDHETDSLPCPLGYPGTSKNKVPRTRPRTRPTKNVRTRPAQDFRTRPPSESCAHKAGLCKPRFFFP